MESRDPGIPPHSERRAASRPEAGRSRHGLADTELPTPPTGMTPVRSGPKRSAQRGTPDVRDTSDPGRSTNGHTTNGHTAAEHTGIRSPGSKTDETAPAARPVSDRVSRTSRHAVTPAPEPVTGHGHGHSPAAPSGRRVRMLIAALLVPCALAALVGLVLLWPVAGPPPTARIAAQEPVRAEVTAARTAECAPGSGDRACLALVLRMADGPLPGRDLVQVMPVEPSTPRFAVGDDVVLAYFGSDPGDPESYQIVDIQRDTPLLWLAALFAGAVLLLGRWRGLASLAALVLSFGVLLVFVLPAILSGRDPLAVAVVGSCLIMFAVLYLTHGPSARTSTAVLGTLVSLALIGALGAGFSAAAELTGLNDETIDLIASLGTGIDARGLLLAGIVIGALGVLDDVTVTQASAVWELRRANPDLGAPALFASAMRIGRDHVASAVNTLVLAYAGAALPLLLLFTLSGRSLGDVATTQAIATEIVRTLVGSIGLVASVPITTALAAIVASREVPQALPG